MPDIGYRDFSRHWTPHAVYSGAAETLLVKLEAEASALVEFGLVTNAASVTTVETAENQNAGELGT
ncbi:hypothetical protein OKHIL_76980 [Mycolicibacterium mageritense]